MTCKAQRRVIQNLFDSGLSFIVPSFWRWTAAGKRLSADYVERSAGGNRPGPAIMLRAMVVARGLKEAVKPPWTSVRTGRRPQASDCVGLEAGIVRRLPRLLWLGTGNSLESLEVGFPRTTGQGLPCPLVLGTRSSRVHDNSPGPRHGNVGCSCRMAAPVKRSPG